MRWDQHEIYVAGTGAAIAGTVDVSDAIGLELYDRAEADKTGQVTVAVANREQGAPNLAVAAARQAMSTAGVRSRDVGIVLHSLVLHSGLDLWNSAAFIQRELGLTECGGAEIRSGCDAAVFGLELAATYICVHRGQPWAVVTAADVWPESVVDRWHADPGRVFGDAGGAVVLSGERGLARLVSTATLTETRLEGLHRGSEPFSPVAHYPFDLRERGQAFMQTMPREEVIRLRDEGMRAAVRQALMDADMTSAADARYVVLPFVGRNQIEREFARPLGIGMEQTTCEWGSRIGHTGPGDQLIGLHFLAESGRLQAGDRVLIVGAGGGFIWTVAVIEMCS